MVWVRLDLTTPLRWLLLCVLVGGIGLVGCRVDPPVRVESAAADVLEEVRQAVGVRALFADRRGTTFFGSRSATVSSAPVSSAAVDSPDLAAVSERPISLSLRPTGPFLLTIGAGGAETARGFDGSEAWVQTGRDVVRRQGLGGREHLIVDGWLRTMLWLTPGYDRFDVDLDERASTPKEIVLTLRRRNEPIEATVTIDRKTRRPSGYSIERLGRTRAVTFDDWREEDGAWFPWTMTQSLDGDVLHTDRFERRSGGTPRTFSPPRSSPTDVHFDASALEDSPSGSLGDGVRIDRGGRFYARVLISGRREAWMLLDTGFGSHAISPAVASELGLPQTGRASLSGIGGAGRSVFRTAGSLTIGALTLGSPRFVELDTPFLSEQAGFTVDGVLGAPLFDRAVVVLDDQRATIEIRDPRRFRGNDIEWQPVLVDGTAPCVRGRLMTAETETPYLWFRLDTGSNDTLTVARWAVRRFGLDEERANLSTRSLAGPFGEILGWRKMTEALEIAGVVVRRCEVTLLRDSAPGPLSDPWIAGNAGTRTLRGRRVILDLSRRRISIGAHE